MPKIIYKNKAGVRLPGVTTIIGNNLGWNTQPLIFWAFKKGKEVALSAEPERGLYETKKEEADAGTVGHHLIDCDTKGVQPDLEGYSTTAIEKGETAFLNYLEWKKNMKMKIIAAEESLVSENYQFGLTPDRIAKIQGKLCIIDWKCANGVYPENLIQMAAYKVGWDENHPGSIITGGFHLLRLAKETAAFHHHHWHALPEAWEAFLHLLELHKLNKVIKKLV